MSLLNLFADEAAGKLVSQDGSAAILGNWVLGDTKRCTLTVVRQTDTTLNEVNLHVRSIAASVGKTMAPPASGTFKLKIADPDDEEVIYESASIAFNADGAAVDAAITAMLATLAWTAEVVQPLDDKGVIVPSVWLVKVIGAASPPAALQLLDNKLKPTSLVRIRAFQEAGDWWHEIRLIEAPLAWNEDGFDRVLPDPPTVARVLAGRAESSTEPAINEIQALHLPADFRGTYFFRWNFRVSRVLGINDGPDEIASALNGMFKDGGKRFQVTNPEADKAYIEFIGDLQSAGQPLITVEVNSFEPGRLTFNLNLDRAGMHAALRAAKEITVPFEIEAEVVDNADDVDNLAVEARVMTLCQQDIKIVREQKWREMGTVQPIDWLRPPSPRNYVPFSADQVITGQQHYSAAIGDGVSREWSLGHNLGTETIAGITVRQNATPGFILGNGTEYTVRIEGEDEVVLFFAGTPPALNSLIVTVTTAGPVSAFQNHTHTIGQITGLQAALDALAARVTDLEDLAPSSTFSSVSASAAARPIAIPDRSDIFPGRFASAPDPKNPKLKPGGLLPALHDASVTSFTALPLGDATAFGGSVFQNNTGAALPIPGGLGRRASVLANAGYFGSDGRLWYRLTRDASTTSYFPTDLERELWKIATNDKQLRAGQRLTIECEVALQMLVATTQMQCFLVIEIGTAPSQTSPATTGQNLENVVWNATPLLALRLILGDLEEKHQYGCTIARAVDGTMSADAMLYDAAIAAANTPASANFVLRARLIRFDTENKFNAATGPNSARGLISFRSSGRGEIK